MHTFINYARRRHFQKSHGWGSPWVKPLWLDALLFAIARTFTLYRPRFRRWCREVDRLFLELHEWPRSMTADTGIDSWIDPFWDGLTPQEAVDSEVSQWGDCQ